MEISKTTVLSCSLAITGLVIVLVALNIPWYQLEGVEYRFLSGENGIVSSDSVMRALNMARTSLAIGAFFAWLFILVSLRGRTKLGVSVGWLSVALLIVAFAYGLSRVTLDSNDYLLRRGWFIGVLGLALLFVAALAEMNKYFAGEKTQKEEEMPF